MAKEPQGEAGLEDEISQLRSLIRKAAEKGKGELQNDELLPVLDSVARAAPQLAHLLKAQRELAAEELDPAALLKQALEELEKEWPELHACKEALRCGGEAPGEAEKQEELNAQKE
jgi:hypothetical protein